MKSEIKDELNKHNTKLRAKLTTNFDNKLQQNTAQIQKLIKTSKPPNNYFNVEKIQMFITEPVGFC